MDDPTTPDGPPPSRWPLHRDDLEAGLAGGGNAGLGSSSRTGTGTTTATAAFSRHDPEHDLPEHGGGGGGGHHHHGASHLMFTTRATGDSGRSGFHAQMFIRVALRSNSKVSAAVNVLWPVVPVALACRYGLADTPGNHLVTFILVYISMVPCANMVGFAGQELSRKVPHVLGILTETTVASIVEIVLFVVLMTRGLFGVIQAAILGSVLATMLLCLGLCFFVGGLRREEQEFSETVSEAGSGLLLTAGFGLAIPTFFQHTLAGGSVSASELAARTLNISRMSALLLLMSYCVFVFFQTRTHHGIYDEVFESDEQRGAQEKAKHHREHELQRVQPAHSTLLPLPPPLHVHNHVNHVNGERLSLHADDHSDGHSIPPRRASSFPRIQRAWTRVRRPGSARGPNGVPAAAAAPTRPHRSQEQAKLTMTESLVALTVSVALVSVMALSLVEEIAFIAEEHGVSDAFMGLILVPLVEKAAEHLTAVDEAWDNQMNFALAHVLGATLQTAMFNGPVAVILGWCMQRPMGLDFNLFDMSVLLLAIITVGNFLRDQKSNYLEGLLCVVVYISIAVAAYNYPNNGGVVGGESSSAAGDAARRLLWR